MKPCAVTMGGRMSDVERAMRDGFGDGLVRAGEADERIVVLSADLTESTRADQFAKRFPKRFIQVGVAEQNLVTVAAGLAAAGKIPFVTSYAAFSPGRNWEQIRTTICYNDLPVKIIGSHAGVSVGPDGATHQALEDLALMRVLPGMVVLAPADAEQAEQATLLAARHPGPVYIRLAREKSPSVAQQAPISIGRAEVVRAGNDVTLIACGLMVNEAFTAATILEKRGIQARVVNAVSIKPLDERTILTAAKETGAVVTIEEHQMAGGLGGAVAELLASRLPTPQAFVGMPDCFGESGPPAKLLEKFHLTAVDIAEAAVHVIERKG